MHITLPYARRVYPDRGHSAAPASIRPHAGSPSSRDLTPQPQSLPQAKATPHCTVLARMDMAHHATTLYNYDHSYS